jgi:hypothetical protein
MAGELLEREAERAVLASAVGRVAAGAGGGWCWCSARRGSARPRCWLSRAGWRVAGVDRGRGTAG